MINAIHPDREEANLKREVASHLRLLEDEYRRRGLSANDARRSARLAFGGINHAKELHRDARAFRWVDDARRDAAYAVRMLRRHPVRHGRGSAVVGSRRRRLTGQRASRSLRFFNRKANPPVGSASCRVADLRESCPTSLVLGVAFLRRANQEPVEWLQYSRLAEAGELMFT